MKTAEKILVTGGTGFIGRSLIKRLESMGGSLRILARSLTTDPPTSLEIVSGDICDAKAVAQAVKGRETVFHLAARVHVNRESAEEKQICWKNNVDGTRLLMKAAASVGVRRFVFFSSVKAMGESTIGCISEDVIPHPITTYGISKLEGEKIVLQIGAEHGIHTVCLRLPMVYGQDNHRGNFIRILAAIDRGFFPPLLKIENRRSMVHIDNVIEAALKVAYNPNANGKSYIVTDSEAYSVADIYKKMCAALGKSIPRWHTPISCLKAASKAGDFLQKVLKINIPFNSKELEKIIGTACYSSEKITQEVGYCPLIGLDEALPQIVNTYRQNIR